MREKIGEADLARSTRTMPHMLSTISSSVNLQGVAQVLRPEPRRKAGTASEMRWYTRHTVVKIVKLERTNDRRRPRH